VFREISVNTSIWQGTKFAKKNKRAHYVYKFGKGRKKHKIYWKKGHGKHR
jgi:hypothetical protein